MRSSFAASVGTDRHDDDLAAGCARVGRAVLEQAQRGLDGVLVERVDDPGRAGQVDVAVLDLGLLRRVGDPLHGNEDLHVRLLLGFETVRDERDDPVGGADDIELLRTRSRRAGRIDGCLREHPRERELVEHAEDHARRDVARDRVVELAALLRRGDDAAEHAQEVGELRVRRTPS